MSTMADEQPVDEAPAEQPRQSRLQAIMNFEITKGRVRRKDLMHFSRQLAVFLRAGIPILEALTGITEEMANKRFKEVLDDVAESLRSGATLASATDAHPDVFPTFYRGMLRSAEATGQLDIVLVQLSDYIERDLEARRKITAALTYPAIVIAMAMVTVVVLTTFVMPKFEKFFASLHAKLPLPTRMLLAIAHFFTHWGLFVLGGIVVVVLAIVLTIRTEAGAAKKDQFLLKLPALGTIIHEALLERFCRIMAAMMAAGVPLPQAMAVTTEAMSNRVFRDRLTKAQADMVEGRGFASPLIETGLFPASARQMFRVGEDTGTLDDQLEVAAVYFDRELDYKLKSFTSLFEPVVIVAVGVVVGFVAIALVSAMYGIFRSSSI